MRRCQQAQQQMQDAQAAAAAAQAKADQAAQQASQQQQAVSDLKTDVSDIKQNATNAALSLQETQKNIQSSLESPVALHYKGINITPVGFLAAETVWRSHALGSDINTPFNSIPFDGAAQSHMSEFFGSGRQSRIGFLAEGALSNFTMRGYVEADFLGAGVTSNNNQSNSYVLRQRQAWGQAALSSGWTFTGGQMWSLVTETKKGMDNRTEALPMTIDPQYYRRIQLGAAIWVPRDQEDWRQGVDWRLGGKRPDHTGWPRRLQQLPDRRTGHRRRTVQRHDQLLLQCQPRFHRQDCV